MRALRYLIPRDAQQSLDASPVFQCLVILFMVALGAFFVAKGIDGFKNKRITGKRGWVFEGQTAEILGVLWIAIGALMILIGIGTMFSRLLALLS